MKLWLIISIAVVCTIAAGVGFVFYLAWKSDSTHISD